MALGNIVNEPRREITETVVGLLAVSPLGYVDYVGGLYLQTHYHPDQSIFLNMTLFLLIMLLGGLIGGLLFFILAAAVHGLGEWLCDHLEKSGLHLRPRQRYTAEKKV